jgi:hypothetical protein
MHFRLARQERRDHARAFAHAGRAQPGVREGDATFRLIIDAYRTAFHQESVLWERAPVCVAF